MEYSIDLFKKSFDFLPLGLKINNIGCIRYMSKNQWNGQKGSYRGFAKFETFEYGVRALTLLLMRYLYKYRLFDIQYLIERYAPYKDGNFPKVYSKTIQDISGLTKVSDDIKLLKIELPLLVYAISIVENGSEYRLRTMDEPYCNYLFSLVSKYVEEYLSQVVYPSVGKVEKL